MFRLIAVLALLGLVFLGLARLRRLPPGQKRKVALRLLFGALLVLLVFLTLTGRIHWLGALLGALIPFAKTLLGLAMQLLPFWREHKKRQAGAGHSEDQATGSRQAYNGKMTLEEALSTLGLDKDHRAGNLTREQVHQAHKRLMQKVHPDRGGNDYLASKINEAKSCVLDHLS